MDKIILQRGDVFCTKNPMMLGRAIMAIETVWSKDNNAAYSHSGIVTDPDGTTLEALWRIKGNDLNAYAGQNVIILRWDGMTEDAYWKGMDAISGDVGRFYPFWRLPLFIIPPLAKYFDPTNVPVCSELACKFWIGAGFAAIGDWRGQTPEDVADLFKWKDVSTVSQGVWQKQ